MNEKFRGIILYLKQKEIKMKKFSEYLKDAGYVVGSPEPTAIYGYFAYKNGKCTQHSTKEDALSVSKNIECVCINQDEINKFRDEQKKKHQLAFDVWYAELVYEYDYLPKGVFEVCYNNSYEDNHSYGYDEVANGMMSTVEFAESIIKLVK